jgi:hypothetical protein
MGGKMGTLNELIEKTLSKKKAQGLDLGNCCIVCEVPKDDINELTCGNPQCIKTILECVTNEIGFSTIAKENEINSPDDLEDYLKTIDEFLDFTKEESLEDAKLKMELIFKMLNVKTLQEMIDEIQSALKKLE